MLFGIASSVAAQAAALGIFLLILIVFGLCALLWGVKELRDEVQAVLQHQQVNIMTALDNVNAALSRLETIAADAGKKLDDNAVTIKDDVAKLAAAAISPQPMTEADANAIVNRVNAVADGLSGHVTPVADAVSAVTTSAADAPQPDAPTV